MHSRRRMGCPDASAYHKEHRVPAKHAIATLVCRYASQKLIRYFLASWPRIRKRRCCHRRNPFQIAQRRRQKPFVCHYIRRCSSPHHHSLYLDIQDVYMYLPCIGLRWVVTSTMVGSTKSASNRSVNQSWSRCGSRSNPISGSRG